MIQQFALSPPVPAGSEVSSEDSTALLIIVSSVWRECSASEDTFYCNML